MDKRTITSLMVVGALLLFIAGVATVDAQEKMEDLNKLNAEITILDHTAKLPQADKVVMDHLTESFDVKKDRVEALKGPRMGYGEVATILAFAEKMDGGINDRNINRIKSLREGRTEWTQIAQNLKVDIGDVADKVSDVESGVYDKMKETLAKGPVKGRAAGGAEDTGAGGAEKEYKGEY